METGRLVNLYIHFKTTYIVYPYQNSLTSKKLAFASFWNKYKGIRNNCSFFNKMNIFYGKCFSARVLISHYKMRLVNEFSSWSESLEKKGKQSRILYTKSQNYCTRQNITSLNISQKYENSAAMRIGFC